MEKSDSTDVPSGTPQQKPSTTAPPPSSANAALMTPFKRLALATGILALCFSVPLYELIRFALQNELYSYTLLIPFVAAYLVWTGREKLSVSKPAPGLALAFSGAAVLLLGFYWFALRSNWTLAPNDRLCLLTLGFLFFWLAACAACLGVNFFRSASFPIGFLFLVAPLPSFIESSLAGFLQHRSADAAYLLLKISGTPILREGTHFMLPGMSIEVAPECSGLRSSLVLIITSLLAGHFFLRKVWTKSLLVPAVILLGILRNAVRIFTISQLCVHVGPHMIDSPLHRRGGPVFFVLSLIPFFLLIWYLRKLEIRRSKLK